MVYYNFRVLLHVFGARWQEESERKKKEQSNRHFPPCSWDPSSLVGEDAPSSEF